MVASHEHDDKLPVTWPFTLAALLVLLGMAWYCLGFAVHDMPTIDASKWTNPKEPVPVHHLPAQFGAMWGALIAAAVLIVLGAWYNLASRRSRLAA